MMLTGLQISRIPPYLGCLAAAKVQFQILTIVVIFCVECVCVCGGGGGGGMDVR